MDVDWLQGRHSGEGDKSGTPDVSNLQPCATSRIALSLGHEGQENLNGIWVLMTSYRLRALPRWQANTMRVTRYATKSRHRISGVAWSLSHVWSSSGGKECIFTPELGSSPVLSQPATHADVLSPSDQLPGNSPLLSYLRPVLPPPD